MFDRALTPLRELTSVWRFMHKVPLNGVPAGFKTIRDKKDGCIKVVLKTGGGGAEDAGGRNRRIRGTTSGGTRRRSGRDGTVRSNAVRGTSSRRAAAGASRSANTGTGLAGLMESENERSVSNEL